MIGRLNGRIDGRGDGWALIDVGGVGYMVEGSARTLDGLPADGEAVTLHIETYAREDQLRLFGFLSEADRGWFRLLMRVNGVGAKAALAIGGVLSPDDLAQAVAQGDKEMVARAPGVGGKLAQRIVQELHDKLPETGFVVGGDMPDGAADEAMRDAVSVLVNLGYPRAQARQALLAARRETEAGDVETIVRFALRELAS